MKYLSLQSKKLEHGGIHFKFMSPDNLEISGEIEDSLQLNVIS
jgi:hypothetical protein